MIKAHKGKHMTQAAFDTIRGRETRVLDKGFIRVVDFMGDDAAIVQAARVSYGDGTKSVREDRGLIRYLMRHWHTSPFEMCEIKLHVKAPLFVTRQWLRHRTASVNEYSARYSVVRDEFYCPDPGVIAKQSKTNGQGRGDAVDPVNAVRVIDAISDQASRSYGLYEALISGEYCEGGESVSRELARIVLPVSAYTEFYWKINLHNLLHFLRLRADSHAQLEIRAYADAILEIVRDWVPATYEAFLDYRLGGVQLSRMEIEAIRRLVRGEKLDLKALGLSQREWNELRDRLQLDDGDAEQRVCEVEATTDLAAAE